MGPSAGVDVFEKTQISATTGNVITISRVHTQRRDNLLFYSEASCCVFLYHNQTKTCRAAHFNVIPHEPSSGSSFLQQIKNISTFEHAVILLVRSH